MAHLPSALSAGLSPAPQTSGQCLGDDDVDAESESAVVKMQATPPSDVDADSSLPNIASIKSEHKTTTINGSPLFQPCKVESSRSSSCSSTKSQATSESSIGKRSESVQMNSDQVLSLNLARTPSQGAGHVPVSLFDEMPDSTMEARSTFSLMETCTYANKYLGYTEHAMECDCAEEWDPTMRQNHACGEDSDCINRATKMECVGDCGCGPGCRNQRFQQREYARVSVIKTEKKGYGLRADADLRPGDFIFEYIGEVINEQQFRRRMIQYDEEGIKHFYFMSLSKGEFVDATKKGNLGRFCNHSCNPNCYVDKWVIGDKLRMGIFAERKIKAGEELVFNYNVDRYGANPQPCYCGEPNCTGFIGGKTQTDRATKLSTATIEALGLDDADGWDTTVARRPRKKKTGEDDEEYVDNVEAKSLDADGVTKVMAALMQCKEKWIAVKLLGRIQRCGDEQVRNRVVKMHGYQILNSQLAAWKEDANVVLQILEILDQFPRLTRNKIIDSKIESTLQGFAENEDERVVSHSTGLLEAWSKLEVAYRIPRKKRDPAEPTSVPQKQESNQYERREAVQGRRRSHSRSRSKSPPRGPSAVSVPSGPRSSIPQRTTFFSRSRPPTFAPLPRGWFQAIADGKTYYYSSDGQTQWTRPVAAAAQPPPPPKAPSNQEVLKSIIDNIVTTKEKEREAKNATPDAPHAVARPLKDKKMEKWRFYNEDQKKKVYKNALHPSISHVMNKYKTKLPRDDLKRFAKEIAEKLANSDFKSGRVDDPTKIDEKHERKIKKYCKDFFDKATHKHAKLEKERAAQKQRVQSPDLVAETSINSNSSRNNLDASPDMQVQRLPNDDNDVRMSDGDYEKETPDTPCIPPDNIEGDSLKRKRADNEPANEQVEGDIFAIASQSPAKRIKSQSPPPPPPPPAPPSEAAPMPVENGSLAASPTENGASQLHADTSFADKSMADVLAKAQQDCGTGEEHEAADDQSAGETQFGNIPMIVDGVIEQRYEEREPSEDLIPKAKEGDDLIDFSTQRPLPPRPPTPAPRILSPI